MNTISFLQEIIKGVQVLLIKGFLLFSTVFLFFACAKWQTEPVEVTNTPIVSVVQYQYKQIKEIAVQKDLITLLAEQGIWQYQGMPFNGYMVQYYQNGILAERIGFFEGKKEGVAKKWFDDGQLQKTSYYSANKLHGEETIWWSNGVIAATRNYTHGYKDGIQQRWYTNGQIARKTHYVLGKEEGLQQAWLENGKIYINYEAKNGRSFGLRKAKLCYALEDEVVQR